MNGLRGEYPGWGSRPAPGPSANRLLALRALGLGDLLTGVPALRALRRAFPDYEIVLAAPAELAVPARYSGAIDTLLPTSAPGRSVPQTLAWTGPPPDVAVDLHGCGPPSHLLLARLRPRHLLAFAHPDTPEVSGPRWCADEHERHRWCRLVSWYGIPASPGDLYLPRPKVPSSAPGAVVLHPGAGAEARRWPAERYARVAAVLRENGQRVVITGGEGEDELATRVARLAGIGTGDLLCGGLPFDRLAALVARASGILSGDTGIAHLAFALNTPSVTLYGPVAPHLWGPPAGALRHLALWHPGPPGDPHSERTDPLLAGIGTPEVLAALSRVTGRRLRGGDGLDEGHVASRVLSAPDRQGSSRAPDRSRGAAR